MIDFASGALATRTTPAVMQVFKRCNGLQTRQRYADKYGHTVKKKTGRVTLQSSSIARSLGLHAPVDYFSTSFQYYEYFGSARFDDTWQA